MFDAHSSIYWGQQKATFWETEERAMFGIDFHEWFYAVSKGNKRQSLHIKSRHKRNKGML